MRTRLTYLQDHDTRLIYLNGKESDIELDHTLLHNHGATDEELEWIFEDRACFYTNEPKLRRGLESIHYHRLLNNNEELSEDSAEMLAVPLAQAAIDLMEKESATPIYLAINRPYKNLCTYGMGTISTPNEKSFSKGE
jgi:hypothetical protein